MSENEKQILQIVDAYKAAVYAKDVETFTALYDEHVRVFDMWGAAWVHQDIQTWRTMASEWFTSLGTERVAVDFEEVQVKQTSGMAFVSAFVKYTGLSVEGKTLRSMQNRLTWVLEAKNGVWKITHEHTSAPVDGNTMKVSLSR